MPTRRELLIGAGATLGSLAVPRLATATVSGTDRKFLFIWAVGGWDPTIVFAPVWSESIQRESPLDEVASIGDMQYVTHPARQAVADFFERYYDQMVVLNGMLVRSVNHPICERLCLTDTPNVTRADWPTVIGYDQRHRYTIPNVVANGPSFAANLSAYAARAGNKDQLNQLISGSAHFRGEYPTPPPPGDLEALMDRYVNARVAGRATEYSSVIEQELTESFAVASDRLIRLKDDARTANLVAGDSMSQQVAMVASMMSADISRCGTVANQVGWDTHFDNSEQVAFFPHLFGELNDIMLTLRTTPGSSAATLADETTVVVISEMGRTPFWNSTRGKDHWPYTSVMIIGSGVVGNRVVGGYDEFLNGLTIDPQTGEPDPDGIPLTPAVLGSTLMTLADVDPLTALDEDRTIPAILA